MAKNNNSFSIMIVLLSSMIAASIVLAADEFAISPQPEPVFYTSIEECSEKISDDCGESIAEALLRDHDISEQCCFELVTGLGKVCHDNILRFLVASPEMGVSASHVYTRGAQIWNTCVLKTSEV